MEPTYAPAIVLGFLSLIGVAALHATLPPDTSLYLHSTSWFYPSPLGRLVGALGGYAGLAFITALSATFLHIFVAKLAERYRRDPVSAAWRILLFPAAWYLFACSVDAGAAFCLVAALAIDSRRISLSLLAVAALFHLALLPSALAVAGIRYLRGIAAGFAVVLTACLAFSYMVATPYGLLVSNHLSFAHFLVRGFLTFLVGIAPLAFVLRNTEKDGLLLTGLVVVSIGALEAAMQQHFQPRYCLPGVLILAAAIAPKVSALYVYEDGARFSRQVSAGVGAVPTVERG